ncbi:MAG: hypothetical protein WC393_01265 [Candidatus Nanoarchaeia archaeon]|jgi:hypothetical protein
MKEIDNTKFLELAQMILLLGNSQKNIIYEKHKFMTFLFFIKNPLYLGKLCEKIHPEFSKNIHLNHTEEYNLLYDIERISVWNSKNDLNIAYLLGKGLVNVELTDKGYSFSLTLEGLKLFKSLKNDKSMQIENIRSKIINNIFKKESFNEIKGIIIDNFKELNL